MISLKLYIINEMARAYHGSGAKFTTFDLDKMNSGEGSLSFGYGIYLTNSKTIGEWYANNSKLKNIVMYKGKQIPKSFSSLRDDFAQAYFGLFLDYNDGDWKKTVGEIKNDKQTDNTRYILNQIESGNWKEEDWTRIIKTPTLYTLEIPDDNGHNYFHLDDKSSPEEIERITKGYCDYCKSVHPRKRYDDQEEYDKLYSSTKEELEKCKSNLYILFWMESDLNPQTATKILQSLGFIGNYYKAGLNWGGTRAKDYDYVIFNPSDIKIKRVKNL